MVELMADKVLRQIVRRHVHRIHREARDRRGDRAMGAFLREYAYRMANWYYIQDKARTLAAAR